MRLKTMFKFAFISLIIVLLFVFVCKIFDTRNVDSEPRDQSLSPKFEYLNDSENWIFGSFLINNSDYCSQLLSLDVLILVHSSLTHFGFRDILRKNVPLTFKAVFMIGQLTDPHFQQLVLEESKKYGDIVQATFYDSYRNLTLKHIMGLTWSLMYCSQATFVLKLDDDIFVNFPMFERYLETAFPKPKIDPFIERTNHKLIACYVQKNMKAIRNESSRWSVSLEEYAGDYFPDFCSGWAYLTTPEVIADLIHQVPENLPPFWIDDVYVMGILRKRISDVSLEYLNKWFNVDALNLYEWIEMRRYKYKWRYMFSNSNGDIALLENSYNLNKFCHNKKSECFCCFPFAKKKEEITELKPKSANGEFRLYRISH